MCQNRWRNIFPSCFDAEAEKAGVHYKFTDLEAMSWSERPVSRGRGKQALTTATASVSAVARAWFRKVERKKR
jgi:hypothetical protein